ncbi:hypothetical protein TL16_g12494 [Triparma laevis f. inornata]|uniref:Apple domain-containing protein n=1 Tax=Triparma laevis f. inornata TaxID=1714386 RepID=A0A9W7BUF0_9STRA|nr:hypothetical protein TL16_g12494 [Triparma laevis f. inornata]
MELAAFATAIMSQYTLCVGIDQCPVTEFTQSIIVGLRKIDAINNTKSVGDCCDACSSNEDCLAFTYEGDTETCSLKDDYFFKDIGTEFTQSAIFPGRMSPYGDGPIPRACSTPETNTYPFCDETLTTQNRVNDLIQRLTLDQKAKMMTARQSPDGGVKELGVPEYDWGTNCIHGVQSRCTVPDEDGPGLCATTFPNPIGLGASFNRTLFRSMASVIGLELRALWLQGVGENHDGNLPHIGLDCWSPNINIARDPRWGRTCETTGEDTFLTGVFGTEYTRGLQENTELDSDYLQAVVTLKHYAAYSLDNYANPAKPDEPSVQRHNYNAVVDPYDAATTFFPAWEMTVKESNPKGVMCSYNEYNGAPSCANKWLMKDVLRDKFGFDGYITGDSGAVEDIYVEDAHNYTDTPEEGIAAALEATTDIASSLDKGDHETGSPFTWYLQDAYYKKLVNDELIDSAMNHSLFLRFELGLFDSSSYENEEGFWHVPKEVINQEAHQKLAREVVEQSFVLLRNDNSLLPLDRETGANVAVIGPHYNASSDLQGNYLGQACAGADRFDYSCIRGVGQAITDANKNGKTTLTKGCDINSNVTSGIADAVDAAKAADYVVLVVGLNTDEIEAESHDRQYISLPGVQDQLIEEVVGAGKPTIVVLIHGGSIGIEYLHSWTGEEDMSILTTFYPGANGADVIASPPTYPKTICARTPPQSWPYSPDKPIPQQHCEYPRRFSSATQRS